MKLFYYMNSSFSQDSFIESTSSHSDYDFLGNKKSITFQHFKNKFDIHINNDYQNKMFSLENLNKDLNEEFKKYFKLDNSRLDSFNPHLKYLHIPNNLLI